MIWNSGTLPPGLKIGDLKREHPSMPRNPDITQVLYLRQYMERIGRGTQNIVKWCTEIGMPAPVWKADETGVTLTFSVRQKLNARQVKVTQEFAAHREIRHSEYCEKYLVSDRQGRRDLEELVAWGFFKRVGGGPKTVFVRTAKPAKTGQEQKDV